MLRGVKERVRWISRLAISGITARLVRRACEQVHKAMGVWCISCLAISGITAGLASETVRAARRKVGETIGIAISGISARLVR
jgi:predicted NUDIX family NTP pyrophosphohydrolase